MPGPTVTARILRLAAQPGVLAPGHSGGVWGDGPARGDSVETARSVVPFQFGGEADNILYEADAGQRAEFLLPTGCRSDAANISNRARRDGDDWVLSGEKTFIARGDDADFAIVVAVTDPDRSVRQGSTAFLLRIFEGIDEMQRMIIAWDLLRGRTAFGRPRAR